MLGIGEKAWRSPAERPPRSRVFKVKGTERVARYFLHLRDGTDELLDPDGTEFADMDALKTAVMFTARDLMAGDIRRGIVDLGFRIDAQDEQGTIVYTLPFTYALQVVRSEP